MVEKEILWPNVIAYEVRWQFFKIFLRSPLKVRVFNISLEFWKLHWEISSFPACLVNTRVNSFLQMFYISSSTFADVLEDWCFFRNFSKFTRKHLCRSVFLIKLQVSMRQVYWKKRFWYRCVCKKNVVFGYFKTKTITIFEIIFEILEFFIMQSFMQK